MNPIENEQVCKSASDSIRHGTGSLASFPGLLRKIIETEAWRERQIRTGEIVQCASLAELIASKPLKGWGEDPKKVEAVIKDDPELLRTFREAMKHQGRRDNLHNNIMEVEAVQGTRRDYTLSRLEREDKGLYAKVVAGELSANAAAIAAGFRKKTVTVVVGDPASAARTLLKHYSREELIDALS